MDYEIAAQTDVGTVKKTNQDSIMMKRIFTNLGNMVFAVLCDGRSCEGGACQCYGHKSI